MEPYTYGAILASTMLPKLLRDATRSAPLAGVSRESLIDPAVQSRPPSVVLQIFGVLTAPPVASQPCWASTKYIASLHWSNGIPFDDVCTATAASCHVAAPSVVRHSCAPCELQPVAGTPGNRTQPVVSSTNDIRGWPPPPLYGGNARCCQLFPSSAERKRYWFATTAQTKLADGALSSAAVGRGTPIGLGDGLPAGWVPDVWMRTQCAPPSTVRCNKPRPVS